MRTYAVDFETFYSKEVTIKTLGNWHYLRHPECEIYMISVVGDDDFKWVGHPRDFDWATISGPDCVWVSHNRSFDGAVFDRLVELGVAPATAGPAEWHCSADAAAYHGLPRNLKGAVDAVFKGAIEMSKDTRDAMKGKRWDDMTEEFKQEVCDYALQDSVACLALWQALAPGWPQHERLISMHTSQMGWKGLPVDKEAVEKAVQTVQDHIWEAEQNIPWIDHAPALSPKALAEECAKVGLVPPKSLAIDDEQCAEWEDKWGAIYPWIGAMRTKRRANAMLKKLEVLRDRITPDGRFPFGIKYAGAHTLRDSGDGGFNCQTMPRDEMYGVNMRHLFRAAPGKTLVLADLSQIEPRTLSVLARDNDFIEFVRGGMSPYEAHARATMGWTGGSLKKENPTMYALSKARCLAAGSLILTDSGYKEIQNIQLSDLIWDGVEFVSHDGVIMSGVKGTIGKYGVRATPEHKFLTTRGWVEWQNFNIQNNYGREKSIQTPPQPAADLGGATFRNALRRIASRIQSEVEVVMPLRLWGVGCKKWKRTDKGPETGARAVLPQAMPSAAECQKCGAHHPRDVAAPSLRGVAVHVGAVLEPETRCLEKLRRAWDHCMPRVEHVRVVLGRYGPYLQERARSRPGQQRWRLHKGKLSLGHAADQQPKQEECPDGRHPNGTQISGRDCCGNGARLHDDTLQNQCGCNRLGRADVTAGCAEPVYDIVNCGPRNRFAVRSEAGELLIAHNCLALGYGSGWQKFITMAKNYVNDDDFAKIFGAPFTSKDLSQFKDYLAACKKFRPRDAFLEQLEDLDADKRRMWVNSWKQVRDYRASNPKITGFWAEIDQHLRASHGEDLVFQMPSGRSMVYKQVQKQGDDMVCVQVRGGQFVKTKLFSTKIVENLCQALARDVFMDRCLEILRAGIDVILRVHDEAVAECDVKDADRTLKTMLDIMSTPPSWMPDLPIGAEGEITPHYKK